MPHFRLVTPDGEGLGPVELSRPDRPDGSVIYRGPELGNLRVVGRLNEGRPETFVMLVVEPVDSGG